MMNIKKIQHDFQVAAHKMSKLPAQMGKMALTLLSELIQANIKRQQEEQRRSLMAKGQRHNTDKEPSKEPQPSKKIR